MGDVESDETGYTYDIMPTMRRTVAWVQSLGFKTCDSGDGVTNQAAGMDCTMPVPHVIAVVDPAEMVAAAHRLADACRGRGLLFAEGFGIEVTYSPLDGVATLMLVGVTDAVLGG